MRVDGNQGGVPGVEPNSFGQWAEQPAYAEPPPRLNGAIRFSQQVFPCL